MQTNRRGLQTFPALLATLLLISTPSLAQTFRGGINGTITDSSGAVVPGAKVTATDVATSASVRRFHPARASSVQRSPVSTYNDQGGGAGFQTQRSPACRWTPARFIPCRSS